MRIANRLVNASTISRTYQISPENLSLYRIIYCLFMVVFRGLPSFSWLTSDYDYVFTPPKISVANLFNGFPSQTMFVGLTCINILSFILMGIGYFTKYSSIIFAITYLLGSNYAFSFGKIDHDLFVIITPFVLGLAGWGDRYSLDNFIAAKNKPIKETTDSNYRSFLISLFALMIGFAFFTSGIVKVYRGWWRWDVEAVKFHIYMQHYFSSGRPLQYILNFNSHIFWKIMDYSTLILETFFLFAAFNSKVFRHFICAAVIFHCFVFFMLHISFASNLIVYVLFINWDKFRSQSTVKTPGTRKYFRFLYKVFAVLLITGILWLARMILNQETTWHPSILRTLIDLIGMRDIGLEIIYVLAFLLLPYIVYVHLSKVRKAS